MLPTVVRSPREEPDDQEDGQENRDAAYAGRERPPHPLGPEESEENEEQKEGDNGHRLAPTGAPRGRHFSRCATLGTIRLPLGIVTAQRGIRGVLRTYHEYIL